MTHQQDYSKDLDEILLSHDNKAELNKPSLNRYFTKNRLLALIQQSRIDELERLSHQKWSDLAYDIPRYLKDRIKHLNQKGKE